MRPAARSPATGDGLRSTSHLLFHCGDKDSVSGRPCAPRPAPPPLPDLLAVPQLDLALHQRRLGHLLSWFRRPPRPLPAPWALEPRVTFKIAREGLGWARRAGLGAAGGAARDLGRRRRRLLLPGGRSLWHVAWAAPHPADLQSLEAAPGKTVCGTSLPNTEQASSSGSRLPSLSAATLVSPLCLPSPAQGITRHS